VLNRVQVIPLTMNTGKLYPPEAYVTVNNEKCKAMTDQIATVSKKRLQDRVGSVGKMGLESIELAMKLQLGL